VLCCVVLCCVVKILRPPHRKSSGITEKSAFFSHIAIACIFPLYRIIVTLSNCSATYRRIQFVRHCSRWQPVCESQFLAKLVNAFHTGDQPATQCRRVIAGVAPLFSKVIELSKKQPFRGQVRLKLLNHDFLAVPKAVSALKNSRFPNIFDSRYG